MQQLPNHGQWIAPLDGGFTLLEVMIALLVLSIGLLGLAALQTSALRTGQMADMRTRAVHAAADMVERMRANPAGTAAGQYEIARNRVARDTSATGTALSDLLDWQASLARLPDGQGEITRCSRGCAGQATHSVTVWWNAARDPAAHGFSCPPRTLADLRCVRLLLH